MIVFDLDPLPLGDQARLKGWFTTPDALLLRDCAMAQMNEHYFNALNKQQNSEREDDKFDHQAKIDLSKAKRIQTFLAVLNEFASGEYEFHKLKVK